MPFQDPGERKDCRRSRDACQEAAAMQWIRHANLQHGRAPQSHEVLSKLSNIFEGREGSPDCQRWVAMTGSEKKHLHRFQRRWALKKGRFGTDAGLSLEMKRTKAICVCLPHTFVCRTHGCRWELQIRHYAFLSRYRQSGLCQGESNTNVRTKCVCPQ